ncbi:MAG: hypothetical protein JRH19_02110 [Deltaproteobacteria bacterium]|nr:hypothetical protein [Deltaproteobacteria bacterium]
MSTQAASEALIQRIVVRIQVGESRMSGSDDPVFLRLSGPSGRDFRLALAKGKSLRRGAEDVYVLAAQGDPETNIRHPEFNDPTAPPLRAGGITGAVLLKGMEPIPNVRGVGELDDRLELIQAEVEIHAAGETEPARYRREGPIWLGLLSGLRLELEPA